MGLPCSMLPIKGQPYFLRENNCGRAGSTPFLYVRVSSIPFCVKQLQNPYSHRSLRRAYARTPGALHSPDNRNSRPFPADQFFVSKREPQLKPSPRLENRARRPLKMDARASENKHTHARTQPKERPSRNRASAETRVMLLYTTNLNLAERTTAEQFQRAGALSSKEKII